MRITDGDGSMEPVPRYGFYGRLTAEFPSQVIVDVTEACNLSCIHCPHVTFRASPHYSHASLDPDLNSKVVDEVREHGAGRTQYIRYCAEGEPFLHRGLCGMIEDAVSRSGVTVTLSTNGTLLDAPRIERLLATGLHVADISIDAFSEAVYSTIRVGGDLAVTRANVQRLLHRVRESGASTKVVVSYVEQPQNAEETADFETFWKDQGADFVVIRRLHSAGGAVADVAEALRKSNRGETRRPCLYPWERIVLNPRGYLAFCPADWTRGSTVVDYRTTTIAETWRGEFYQGLRQAHLNNDFKGHAFCGQCPDWRSTRWPDEGRSYANMVEEFKETE